MNRRDLLRGGTFGLTGFQSVAAMACNDNTDFGLTVGLSVMQGVIAVLGGAALVALYPEVVASVLIAATFGSSFLSGMLSTWASSRPPTSRIMLRETFEFFHIG